MSFKKTVTIRDVSEHAGVSIATVSRVLNNPNQVKESTRQRVLSAAKALNFTPNSSLAQHARKASQSPFVYLFVPNMFNPSITAIAQGAADYLEAQQIHSVIWNCDESASREQMGRQFILDHPAQGVIVILSTVEDMPLSGIAAVMPVVAVEYFRQEKGIDYLHIDNEQAMHLLVEHLAELGHRKIAFLCGDISSSNAMQKIAAFKKALHACHLQYDVGNILSTQWNIEGGYRGIKKLMEWSPDITAVICISDLLALGAIHGLQEMGLRCPQDVSIAGFDHIESFAYLQPKLTTLDFPSYQMGRDAAQQIVQKMQSRKSPDIQKAYPVQLCLGDSTGPVCAQAQSECKEAMP